MINTVFAVDFFSLNYNLTIVSRAWATLLQGAHWVAESLPFAFYYGILVAVSAALTLIPAVIIYRAVDWLHRGGLRYSAIKRAKKRRQMAGR